MKDPDPLETAPTTKRLGKVVDSVDVAAQPDGPHAACTANGRRVEATVAANIHRCME